MEVFIDLFITIFDLITENSFLGIPVLVWFILPAVIGVIVKFIQGKR